MPATSEGTMLFDFGKFVPVDDLEVVPGALVRLLMNKGLKEV